MWYRCVAFSGLILAIASAVWGSSVPDSPAQPWPGPRGEYVFVEAESFQNGGKGWVVKQSPHGIFGDRQSGLKYLSGSPADKGIPTRTIQIPADGLYRFWVRYSEQPVPDADRRGPFQVTLSQDGKILFNHTYDETYQGQPGKSSFDPDFVWKAADARLARGKAIITLKKVGPDTVRPDVRQVDCLLLTTDLSYTPNYRDFAPQTYVRIRLIQAEPAKIYFHGFLDHMHAPWYRHIVIGSEGYYAKSLTRVPQDQMMSAGQSTGWVNFSRMLDSDSDTTMSLQATVHYHNPDASRSAYIVDFAAEPRDKAIVATFKRSGPGAGMEIRIPPDLTGGRKPISDLQYATRNLELAGRLKLPSFGRVPSRFPLTVGMGGNDNDNTPGTQEAELKTLEILGMDGLWNALNEPDIRAGMFFGRTYASVANYRGPGGYTDPKLDAMEKSVAAGGKAIQNDPLKDHYVVTTLMDEAVPQPLSAMAGKSAYEQAFVNWLKKQKLRPEDLGVSDWTRVKLTPERDSPHPALYRQSQRFRAWGIADFFASATALVHKFYPPKALTTQNFSDGAVYYANLYGQGNDYYIWFRHHALDMAWSEDASNLGSTPQLCGWNVALMRSATQRHHQPIGMYAYTSYGRTPLDVKLKAYSDIAQGAKMLSFYSYSPLYSGHEPGWYLKGSTYAAVMELTREVGAAEDVLMDAMPRPAQTVIIYSRDYDIWNAGYDNFQGNERMHTYLALRQNQDAVDVVDGEDVVDGQLAGRKVAYLFGEQLDRQCVAPLVQWVKAGGTLVLSPGAGSRDELNRPNDALDRGLGLSRRPESVLQRFRYASRSLGNQRALKPLGKVRVEGQQFDYFGVRQDLAPGPGDKVLATFDDGKPAYVAHPAGAGRVAMSGFLPAVSYINKALVDFKPHQQDRVSPLPCVKQAMDVQFSDKPPATTRYDYSWAPPAFCFDAGLRNLIDWPVHSAATKQPVQADVPLVEATLMEGSKGWVVPLANWSGAPLKKVTVKVYVSERTFGDIYSSRQGRLETQAVEPGTISVQLPLDSTDMLYASWR